MPANPEVQIKALEKKTALYDKKFEQYDKQLRQVDYDALVKKLKNLEKMIFAIAASLKEVKDVDKLMTKAGALNEKSAYKLAQAIAEKESEKVRKQMEKEDEAIKRENDKRMKQMEKDIEKWKKEAEEAARKSIAHVEKMNVERRLTILEGLIKTLGR